MACTSMCDALATRIEIDAKRRPTNKINWQLIKVKCKQIASTCRRIGGAAIWAALQIGDRSNMTPFIGSFLRRWRHSIDRPSRPGSSIQPLLQLSLAFFCDTEAPFRGPCYIIFNAVRISIMALTPAKSVKNSRLQRRWCHKSCNSKPIITRCSAHSQQPNPNPNPNPNPSGKSSRAESPYASCCTLHWVQRVPHPTTTCTLCAHHSQVGIVGFMGLELILPSRK